MAKTPMYNLEAEQAVIGGAFVAPVQFAEVAARVTAGDFSREDHRLMFQTMATLTSKNIPLDLVTVGERLEADGHCPDPVDFGYLVSLAKETPSAANVLTYADIVRSYAQRRHLVRLAGMIPDWVDDERDAGKVISKIRQALDALERRQNVTGLRPLGDILPEVLTQLDERAHRTQALLGQSTGLPELDTLLDGLCPGRLYVIAGRPSSGKSVMGMQCARLAMQEGKRVAFFSLEMPAEEVTHRLLSAEIPLDLGRIQSAKMADAEWGALADTCAKLANASLWIDESSQVSIGELQARTRRLHRQAPVGLVVVDYLGLIDSDRNSEYSNRVQEVSDITCALKQLAKELNCPVLLLAQLNRKLEDRSDKRPILSDLRESGSVEQDADVVLMVYRDEIHHPDSPDKGCAELLVRKNRGGKIGMVAALFRGEHCQFLPLAGDLPSKALPPAAPSSRPKPAGKAKRTEADHGAA